MGSCENKESEQINKDELLVDYEVMHSVGFEQLDNFFSELVLMLKNLKRAHSEIKAKSEAFFRKTEVDLLKNYTINDGVMSMLYCLVASNGRKTEQILLKTCTCCQSFTFQQERSPYISFTGELSKENAHIYNSWLEFAEVLTWTSLELEPIREFRSAVEICEKLRTDFSKVPLNMDNFNKNLQKLQVASRIAERTHKLVSDTKGRLMELLNWLLKNVKDIHTVATQAKETRCFTPSQIISRYWPDQSRVLGKVSQRMLRMNLVPAPVDEVPTSRPSVDEESKQQASNVDKLTCLVCLSLCLQAEEAVELDCCHLIVCEKCITQLNSMCPNCRMNFAATPSIPRPIGNLAWRFSCGYSPARSETKSHLESCPKRLKCRFKDCVFLGDKADLKAHILSAHVDDIMAEYC
jgi:hypothetical protein